MELKTLDEINREFNEELCSAMPEPAGKPTLRTRVFRRASDFLFYFAIIVILYSVLSLDAADGRHHSFMGYSYFTVMSSSMSNEIPKGSLIFVRRTDAGLLKEGDNITYLREGGTTVTHKIIEVFDNYLATNERGFVTKGNNNANPDPNVVHADAVIGKVVMVLPRVGAIVISIGENVHIVLIIFLLCSALSFSLRGISNKKKGWQTL